MPAKPNPRHEAAKALATLIRSRGGHVTSLIPPVPPEQDIVRFEAPAEIAASIGSEIARQFPVEPLGTSTRIVHDGIVETYEQRSSDGIVRQVVNRYPGPIALEAFSISISSVR